MSDYLQPDFYRFNEDSLLLVKKIVEKKPQASSVLDIGAGSGIIGIELALKLEIPVVHFVELQREWEESLVENIRAYIPERETKIFWSSISKWRVENKYDLIVSNPPYYLPGNGKISPDPVRAKCRSFLEDGWKVLMDKSLSALNPEGVAWFATPRENLAHIQKEGSEFHFSYEGMGELVILKLSRRPG